MTPDPVMWVCEWCVFPDHVLPPALRRKLIKSTRTFHQSQVQADAEQQRQRELHKGNINFVSSVTPWVPSPPKPPKKQKGRQ